MPKEVQITEAQFEIWLDSPVTRRLLESLETELADQIEKGGNGSLIDSSNADLTHALLHSCLGSQEMLGRLLRLEEFLDYHGKIIYPEPEPNADE